MYQALFLFPLLRTCDRGYVACIEPSLHMHVCTHTHTSQGAESLLVNGVNNPLCISMADAMATKLKPRVWEKQVELDSYVRAVKLNHFHRVRL